MARAATPVGPEGRSCELDWPETVASKAVFLQLWGGGISDCFKFQMFSASSLAFKPRPCRGCSLSTCAIRTEFIFCEPVYVTLAVEAGNLNDAINKGN